MNTAILHFLGMGHLRPLFKHVTASGHCSILHMVRSILRPCHVSWHGLSTRAFKASVAPGATGCLILLVRVDESLEEMKQRYEVQRDKEFAAHVCAEHPRVTRSKAE